MPELIMDMILNYGAFPGIVLYQVIVMVKDYRKDLKELKKEITHTSAKLEASITEQNENMSELILVLERMQNTMANQMSGLMIKFIEMSMMKNNGGDK